MTAPVGPLRKAFRTALDEHADVWFPRIVDMQSGGFKSDFDYKWRANGPNHRMLEYQARTLRFVSRVAMYRPELRPVAQHGFRFIADVMWDTQHGGIYRMVDTGGAPLEDGVKHGHGTAYAISACTWYHRLSGSTEALELAQRAFAWMEQHAHDDQHGGYFSFYRRDGSLILDGATAPKGHELLDPLGNPIGFKETNTSVDMMEALGELYLLWPDSKLAERLAEMFDIVMDRVMVEPGVVHLAFTRQWTPLPQVTSYAECFQVASLIIAASRALGSAQAEARALAAARMMVDHMLRTAWDTANGGFHFGGWAFGPVQIEGCSVFVPDKIWWCQAEALRALVILAESLPDESYWVWVERHWQYIDRFMVDHRYGGWNRRGRDSVRYDKRAAKTTVWKDPGHEGVALLIGAGLVSTRRNPDDNASP